MSSSEKAEITTSTLTWAPGRVSLAMDQAGSGRSILLLPALSSISTRTEMTPLLEHLAPSFRVSAVDWPGFGDRPRPKADWSPDMLSAFLEWVFDEIVPEADAVVATGHAAAYAAHYAAHHPNRLKQLVLVAPTWRGPLPTMMGGHRPWFDRIVTAIDVPLVGPLLYRANMSRPVLRMMGREHVYDDPTFLEGGRLAAKETVTGARGARHASARFVTGKLDRVASRGEFLDLVRRAALPTLVIYGAGTPKKSLAEMEALAACPGVEVEQLSRGRLALQEEFPEDTARLIRRFLSA